MFIVKILILLILLFLAWVFIDLTIGRIIHLKKIKNIYPTIRYSDIELITSGRELYNHLFDDIRQAKTYIHIMFFIVNNDQISKEFIQLLIDRARENIEVRLLVDRIGSIRLSKKNIQLLKENGVHFSYCHPIRFPFLFFSLNQRNHRKVTIIDGKIAYLGGFNIGDEYLGKDKKLGKWRDYHLLLRGQGVEDLQSQFLQDWYQETKEKLSTNKKYFPLQHEGAYKHIIVPTHGAYLKQTFIQLIMSAKQEIIIGTPYFIPGKRIMNALLTALEKGISVKILVPLVSDHPLVREGEFPYFRRLLKYENCHVYHYLDGFFHAKVVVIDEVVCDIGTANMDLRSLYLNHETNCITYDKNFIKIVKKELALDFSKSEPVYLERLTHLPFKEKVREWIATLLTPFL